MDDREVLKGKSGKFVLTVRHHDDDNDDDILTKKKIWRENQNLVECLFIYSS